MFQAHPCNSLYQYLIHFYCCTIFHCISILFIRLSLACNLNCGSERHPQADMNTFPLAYVTETKPMIIKQAIQVPSTQDGRILPKIKAPCSCSSKGFCILDSAKSCNPCQKGPPLVLAGARFLLKLFLQKNQEYGAIKEDQGSPC